MTESGALSLRTYVEFLTAQLEKEKELSAEVTRRAELAEATDPGNFCHCCIGGRPRVEFLCEHQLCAECFLTAEGAGACCLCFMFFEEIPNY
jgi:hypothetical protein